MLRALPGALLRRLKGFTAPPDWYTTHRFFIDQRRFESILEERTRKLKMGQCIYERTTRGPLMILNGLNKAPAEVEDANKHGGQILLGVSRITGSEGKVLRAHDCQARDGRDAYYK